MSHPAIYIAPQGTTSHVPPRYTPPGSARPRPRMPPAPPPNLMVRYSRIPIRHTEFGIRNPRIGNRGTEISSLIQRFPLDDVDHGAVGCAP